MDKQFENMQKLAFGKVIAEAKKGTLTDDLYHPCLRLYTDGSLYNIVKQSYLFKKTIPSHTDPIPKFLSSNLFDIILDYCVE